MWAVNSGHNPSDYPATGQRNSNGILYQPRASFIGPDPLLQFTTFDLDQQAHPSPSHLFATPLSATLSRSQAKLGAVWLSCDMRAGLNGARRIGFLDLVAEIRVTNQGYLNPATGLPSTSLLLDVLGQRRIIRDFNPGLVTFCAGICLVGNQFRFVAWVSVEPAMQLNGGHERSAYGAGTAVCSVNSGGAEVAEKPLAFGPRILLRSPFSPALGGVSPWIQCFAEHYGPFLEIYDAIPEDSAELQSRLNGYPGARRQKQQNALVPVLSLPTEDCGQMPELTRPDASVFFVQCLKGYANSERMPYLPNDQARNLHNDPAVNSLLHRLRVVANGVLTSSSGASIEINSQAICVNTGNGLNEYSGVSGQFNEFSFLFGLYRRDLESGDVQYGLRGEIAFRRLTGNQITVASEVLLSDGQHSALFDGSAVTIGPFLGQSASFSGTVTVQAIGAA
jgi:hypothetical protein